MDRDRLRRAEDEQEDVQRAATPSVCRLPSAEAVRSRALDPGMVLSLQRSSGNAAVASMMGSATVDGPVRPADAVRGPAEAVAGTQHALAECVQRRALAVGSDADGAALMRRPAAHPARHSHAGHKAHGGRPVRSASTMVKRKRPPRRRATQGDLAMAARIKDIGRKFTGRYSYGGGHGVPLSKLKFNAPMDCSSSTSKAMHAAGLFSGSVAIVSGTFASSWGKPGRGKAFTVWANDGHVFVQSEAGKRWRLDTSGGFPGEGPRIRDGHRSTAGFTSRHMGR